ncbi:hypothetical protein ABGB08_30115 [Acrocarpospora sp. B8E8]
MLDSGRGSIVNVAAARHRDATGNLEDLDSLDGYDMRTAYDRTKLANVSFTLELARRLAGTTDPGQQLLPRSGGHRPAHAVAAGAAG